MVSPFNRKRFSENPDGTIPGVWETPRPELRKVPRRLDERRSDAIGQLLVLSATGRYHSRLYSLQASQKEIDARDPHDPFRKYNWNYTFQRKGGRKLRVPPGIKREIREIRKEWLTVVYADILEWDRLRTQAVNQYLKRHNLKHTDTYGNILLILFVAGPLALALTFIIEFFTFSYNLPGWIWVVTIISTLIFVGYMFTATDDGPADVLNKARHDRTNNH